MPHSLELTDDQLILLSYVLHESYETSSRESESAQRIGELLDTVSQRAAKIDDDCDTGDYGNDPIFLAMHN